MTEPPKSPQDLNVQSTLIVHAVGECLMAWAMVEESIHELFVQQVVSHSENKNRFTIARSVWFSVQSFDHRLKMADAAIKANHVNKTVLEDWRLIMAHVIKLSSFRNDVAHGMLANFNNKEMKVMPYGTNMLKRRDPLSFEEVKRRTALLAEFQNTLSWFRGRTSNQIKPNALLDTLPLDPLIKDLRARAEKTRKSQTKAAKSRESRSE